MTRPVGRPPRTLFGRRVSNFPSVTVPMAPECKKSLDWLCEQSRQPQWVVIGAAIIEMEGRVRRDELATDKWTKEDGR